MARFFVGQRVRFVRRPEGPIYEGALALGAEGTITSMRFSPKGGPVIGGGTLSQDSDCIAVFNGNDERSMHTSMLEPATDANEKTTWEAMKNLWQPEEYKQAVSA